MLLVVLIASAALATARGLVSRDESKISCSAREIRGTDAALVKVDDVNRAIGQFCSGYGWPDYLVAHINVGDHFTDSSMGHRLKSPSVELNFPVNEGSVLLKLSIAHTEDGTASCPVHIPVVADHGDIKAQCTSQWNDLKSRCVDGSEALSGGTYSDGCRIWSISAASSSNEPIRGSVKAGLFSCQKPQDITDDSDVAGPSKGPADLKWCECKFANYNTTALFRMTDGDAECRRVDPRKLLYP